MTANAPPRRDIKDLTSDQLVQWLGDNGIAPYRAGQILRWIHQRQVDRFADMTDLSKSIRALLASRFTIERLSVEQIQTSADGSQKFLLRLADDRFIESVLIPEKGHWTLCLSSQVGCAQGCRFCATAAIGFSRHLAPGEILAQVRDINRRLPDGQQVSNLVFMGMGEPLANYANVRAAIDIMTDSDCGMGFSARRITLSTAGWLPRLADLGRDTDVNLAVSLNATDNPLRTRLMPINRRFPIEQLLSACRRFPLRPSRRITFEYILLAGVNDSRRQARQLATLLHGLRAKINLIPFNPHTGSPFAAPEEPVVQRFRDELVRRGYTVIVRRSKGRDIAAACGQLSIQRNPRI